jgi:hypothetical protein
MHIVVCETQVKELDKLANPMQLGQRLVIKDVSSSSSHILQRVLQFLYSTIV